MENVINQLKPVFEKVAEKIGQGAEWGWAILIKQQYVVAINNAVVVVLCIIAIPLLVKFVKYTIKKSQDERWGSWELGTFFGCLAIIVSIILGMCCASATVGRLINPQYYALRDVASFVQGNNQ